jgi:hypothetical protein
MTLETYFESLLERLESSDIGNDGKDANGFFEPTRAMLYQRLSLLRDLHGKPPAKAMVRTAWQYVVDHAPAEWLKMDDSVKKQIAQMLA